MQDCNCPPATELTDIPDDLCSFNMEQVQKFAFQRYQVTSPLDDTDILDLSAWQALLAISDDTKIVVTPFVGGSPAVKAGDKITTGGGDNTTLNGIEELNGIRPSSLTAIFKSLTPETEEATQSLMCEKNLTVWFFLQGGRIAYLHLGVNENKGFPIQSFFFSDRNNDGFGTKDTHNLSAELVAGWSNKMKIVKPTTWNPLTDL